MLPADGQCTYGHNEKGFVLETMLGISEDYPSSWLRRLAELPAAPFKARCGRIVGSSDLHSVAGQLPDLAAK